MIVFCSICKRHVDLGDTHSPESVAEAMRRFRDCGHDDTPVRELRHGDVGWYSRDKGGRIDLSVIADTAAPVAEDVAECFENEKRIAA